MSSKCPDCFNGYIIITTAHNEWEEICPTCNGSTVVSRTVCSKCDGLGDVKSYREIHEHRDGNGVLQARTEVSHSVECPDCNGTGYLD